MGNIIELVTPLHKRTTRDYLARMNDDKVHCMEVAREYEQLYWDGDRRYGYGGYHYISGYWTPVAEKLIARYGLTTASSVLDVGCGKAYLLREIVRLLPGITVFGIDPSLHAIGEARASLGDVVVYGHAQEPTGFADDQFDLVLAMGSLHNLKNWERAIAYKEIMRVGKQQYLWVESYRNAREQFNLECWALTCWAFMTPEEWTYEFKTCGYTGDYEFIYFE